MAHPKYRRSRQFATNSNLTIPDNKPDIDFLLRVTSTPIIEQCVVSPRQLHLTGYVNIYAEYVASVHDGTQPVTFIFFKLPFDETFVHTRARTGMNAYLKCDINTQQLQLINSRELAISLNVRILGVKLARSYHSLPPHQCNPCFVNFFESSNTEVFTPTCRPELGTDQSDNQQTP